PFVGEVGRNSFRGKAAGDEATTPSHGAVSEPRGFAPGHGGLLLLRQCDGDIAVADPAVVVALKVNRPRLALVAVERAAGDARDFLVIDHGFAVEYDRHLPADKRDVIHLPLRIELERLGRADHAVDAGDAAIGVAVSAAAGAALLGRRRGG